MGKHLKTKHIKTHLDARPLGSLSVSVLPRLRYVAAGEGKALQPSAASGPQPKKRSQHGGRGGFTENAEQRALGIRLPGLALVALRLLSGLRGKLRELWVGDSFLRMPRRISAFVVQSLHDLLVAVPFWLQPRGRAGNPCAILERLGGIPV